MRNSFAPTLLTLAVLSLGGCQSLTQPETIDYTEEWQDVAEVDRLRWFKEINTLGALKEEKLTGSGVTVTIMGEMVDAVHPDLANNVSKQYNAWLKRGTILSGNGNQAVGAHRLTADDGHGTHIAGTIAAACDGNGVQGLACGSTLEVYSLGAYDSAQDWPIEGWGRTNEFERFIASFTASLNDIARRKSSRIVTGSFNMESPAIRYRADSTLKDKSVSDMIASIEENVDGLADLDGKGFAKFENPRDQAFLEQTVANNGDDLSIALISTLPLSKQWQELEDAIVRYQNTDGVYLVTESNYNFDGRSSTLNAFPSLSEKVDPDLWLSVVMVQPTGLEELSENFTEATIENLLTEKSYSLPLNSCGEMAANYCILTPSWSVLSTMTERVAFKDGGPLVMVDGRVHQSADGHSMGAPMVAATLALMEEHNRKHQLGHSMKDMVRMLKDSANRSFPGYNPKTHGRGLLDVDAAIAAMGA